MTPSRKVYIRGAEMEKSAANRTAVLTVVVTGESIEELISNLAVVTKEIGRLDTVVAALNQAEQTVEQARE